MPSAKINSVHQPAASVDHISEDRSCLHTISHALLSGCAVRQPGAAPSPTMYLIATGM